jgi:ankyrin repeat protein
VTQHKKENGSTVLHFLCSFSTQEDSQAQKTIAYTWFGITFFVLVFLGLAIAGAVNQNCNYGSCSPGKIFFVIWNGLMCLGLAIAGKWVLHRHQNSYSVGIFLGALFILACDLFVVGFTFFSLSMDDADASGTDDAAGAMSILVGLMYGGFGVMLYRCRHEVITEDSSLSMAQHAARKMNSLRKLLDVSARCINSAGGPSASRLKPAQMKLWLHKNAGAARAAITAWLTDPGTHIEDTEPEKNQTALVWLARHGADRPLLQLLQAGADPNAQMKGSKATALYVAAQEGHLAATELLLAAKASTDNQIVTGATALFIACRNNHANVAAQLLRQGASANVATSTSATPLLIAVRMQHTAVTEVLLQLSGHHGGRLDVNHKMPDGCTALFHAAQEGYHDAVLLLCQNGARVNEQRDTGASATFPCVEEGHNHTLQILVREGANANVVADDGTTALMLAAHGGQTQCTSTLIRAGANVDAALADGTDAVLLAAQSGHLGCLELLLKAGAKPHSGRDDGVTAFALAHEFGHVGCAQALATRCKSLGAATPAVAAPGAGAGAGVGTGAGAGGARRKTVMGTRHRSEMLDSEKLPKAAKLAAGGGGGGGLAPTEALAEGEDEGDEEDGERGRSETQIRQFQHQREVL